MYTLAEELDFIWGWLDDINPDPEIYNFRCYQPGLSREKITSLTADLPFTLPKEIYQLYQWKNGMADIYDDLYDIFLFRDQVYNGVSLGFYPLQSAVKEYGELSELGRPYQGQKIEFWNDQWFPIGGFEGKLHLYVDCSVEPSPVVQYYVESHQPKVRTYKSLTAMLSVMAECCERDMYQLLPNKYAGDEHVMIRIDETKLEIEKEIFRKYHP